MTFSNDEAYTFMREQKKELIAGFLQSIDRIEDASIRETVNNDLDIFGDIIEEERKKWEAMK